MKKIVLLSCLATALLLPTTTRLWAQKDEPLVMPSLPAADAGVEITADKFEVDQQSGWTTAIGNVVIKSEDHQLNADHVRLHTERGDVQARGHVKVQQRSFGAWSGDYLEYNYITGVGLSGLGELQAGFLRIGADEIIKHENNLFEARQADISTCTNAPGHRHWRLTGHVKYQQDDYIEVYNVVPWFLGIPIGWVPYWYRSLDTHYGLRLIPGYTSRWGAYMLGTYVFNIYRAPHENGPRLDGSSHVDLRTKRGIAIGQNLYWDLKRLGRGNFEFYHAWDEDLPGTENNRNWMSDLDRERYRFRLKHNADLSPRDQLMLRGTFSSDSRVRHDFFERESRGESIPMNYAAWEHREHTWAAGVTASGRLNDFYASVARLPEGWLNIMPQPLWFTGLNYESQSRAGYLDRDAAYYKLADPEYRYQPGPWAAYNSLRGDTMHRLTYPLKLYDTLSLVPRAGYRATWYADSEVGSSTTRHAGDIGLEASIRAVADLAHNYRHIAIPYLDYSYLPTHTTHSPGRTFAFDRFDRSIEWLDQFGHDGVWLPYKWHGVRPGLRNLLQYKDDGQMRTLIDWDLYAAAQFTSEGPLTESGLRMLGSKIIINPQEDLDLRVHGDWDVEESTFAYADLSAFYRLTPALRLGGGYLARDHRIYDYDHLNVAEHPATYWDYMKANLIYGGFTHDFNDTWSWSFFTRYDQRNHELDEIGGTLQYRLDCLVFQIRTSYVNSYKRVDGTERDDDFRFAFMVWLRADDRTPADEWLTW